MNDYISVSYGNNVLVHHGILGQKWGVRRYQNYNGSYTQAGLKRYNKSKEVYDKARNSERMAKDLYKGKIDIIDPNTGEPVDVKATKNLVLDAKHQRKVAQNQMNKDYKHLKLDKRADEGKRLYSEGYRITNNAATTAALASLGGLAISAVALSKYGGSINLGGMLFNIPSSVNRFVNTHSKEIVTAGGLLTAAAAAKKAVTYNKDQKFRAFYSHTSNY